MGWRSVIVTQHAKMSYSAGLMVVQTMDGTSEIPLDDMALLMVSTTQAVNYFGVDQCLGKKQH